jgi:hypothetical protein
MFDRLGRRDDETPFVVEWFVRQGIEVWSVKEGQQRFDSHVDKLTNYIRFWQASGESIKTSIRTKTSLGQIVCEGHFRGGGVPYGYRIERQGRVNKRNHEVYEILTDDYEAAVVKQIFEMYSKRGFGTQTLATRLTEQGILNRSGRNFHPATVLNMLKNPMYRGIIRSGETYSESFPHLRLIDEKTWEQAQFLICQRSGAYEEKRRMPKMIKGDSLLSGNIFCGHCGARLTLTTAGKAYECADGRVVPHKYLRYVCYNRTRHKDLCDGQTGYAAKTIDECVENSLREVFDSLRSVSKDTMIETRVAGELRDREAQLAQSKKQLAKRVGELADLKAEVVKVIQGKSKWSVELLNETVAVTEREIRELQVSIMTLEDEHRQTETLYANVEKQYVGVLDWAKTFAASDMATKKMIASQLLDRVEVSRGNRVEITFSLCLAQFLEADSVPNADSVAVEEIVAV